MDADTLRLIEAAKEAKEMVASFKQMKEELQTLTTGVADMEREYLNAKKKRDDLLARYKACEKKLAEKREQLPALFGL